MIKVAAHKLCQSKWMSCSYLNASDHSNAFLSFHSIGVPDFHIAFLMGVSRSCQVELKLYRIWKNYCFYCLNLLNKP